MIGETTITERRKLTVARAAGSVEWTVSEFDHGRNYMLQANASGTSFSAHFDAEQWAQFQELVAGVKA